VSSRVAATGFQPRTRPSFAGAIRSELLKIRRQAMTWVLLAVIGAVAAVVLGETLASGRPALDARASAYYFNYLSVAQALFDVTSGVFLLATTARLIGMEYSGGTVRIVLARGTARLELLGAQLAALALCGLLLLAAFVAVATAALGIAVWTWNGSLSPLTWLPAAAGPDTGICLLVALVSTAVCILLATAAAAIGRSLPFAVGAALAFFPADSFGTIVMYLLGKATHDYGFWYSLTQWFLGPSLNQLAATLQTDHASAALLPAPLVKVTADHLWTVIGAWSALLAIAAVLLTWRRDVLE
jgi:ABC-type transport system involved in multi-copper enzyme maturation permease subunit